MPSRAEQKRRYTILRGAMRSMGCEALVIAGVSGANERGYIRYVTDWRLANGNAYVVFPLEGAPVLVLGLGSAAYWAKNEGWNEDVRSVKDKISEVVKILKGLHVSRTGIGVVGMDRLMPYHDIRSLTASFPEAQLEDATLVMNELMVIKSQEEINLAAETYRLLANGIARVKELLVPGITEKEIMSDIIGFMARYGCLDGAANISNDAPPFIRPASDRLIRDDEIIKVALEFAGPNGYWIELGAIFSFRDPPDREYRIHATARKAVQRASSLMRPGAKSSQLSNVIEETYREDGWDFTERILWDVHGIGLNVIESPIGHPDSKDELKQNMILSIHPGLVVGDDRWGVYVYDNLVVTPEGGRPLIADFKNEWNVQLA